MEEVQEKLARVARDTMIELVSRGVPAHPRNYQAVFLELCHRRGLPADTLEVAAPPPPASTPLDGELVSLLLAVAELARRVAPGHPGVTGVIDSIQVLTASDAVERDVLAELLHRLDRLNLELQAEPASPPASGAIDGVLKRVTDVLRLLVPLADPEGVEKESAMTALNGLAAAHSQAEVLPHLDVLSGFAALRRKAVAQELLASRQLQRRGSELHGLVDAVLELLTRVLTDVPEVEGLLGQARIRIPSADARALQEIRLELTSHFQRLQGATAPVQEQKTVIKGVLRTLADQLARASSGSAQFEKSALEIRRRVEATNDMTELRQLQEALVREAGAAASEANKMRGQLGELSTQVHTSQQQIDSLERALVETKQAMNLDALTRVPNRRALTDWVDATLYPPARPEMNYSLLVLDLDHFKKVNDTHGHMAGDAVLAETAKRVKLGIRDLDFLARYGGEEFVLVLPDCDLSIARAVAERMCMLVARKPVTHDGTAIPVTTSIGVATKRAGENFKVVFERADQCVYLAKQAGRNRAVTEAAAAAAAESSRLAETT